MKLDINEFYHDIIILETLKEIDFLLSKIYDKRLNNFKDDYLYKKALKDFNSYGRTIFNVYYFTCIKIICEKYNRIEKLKRVLL